MFDEKPGMYSISLRLHLLQALCLKLLAAARSQLFYITRLAEGTAANTCSVALRGRPTTSAWAVD